MLSQPPLQLPSFDTVLSIFLYVHMKDFTDVSSRQATRNNYSHEITRHPRFEHSQLCTLRRYSAATYDCFLVRVRDYPALQSDSELRSRCFTINACEFPLNQTSMILCSIVPCYPIRIYSTQRFLGDSSFHRINVCFYRTLCAARICSGDFCCKPS